MIGIPTYYIKGMVQPEIFAFMLGSQPLTTINPSTVQMIMTSKEGIDEGFLKYVGETLSL